MATGSISNLANRVAFDPSGMSSLQSGLMNNPLIMGTSALSAQSSGGATYDLFGSGELVGAVGGYNPTAGGYDPSLAQTTFAPPPPPNSYTGPSAMSYGGTGSASLDALDELYKLPQFGGSGLSGLIGVQLGGNLGAFGELIDPTDPQSVAMAEFDAQYGSMFNAGLALSPLAKSLADRAILTQRQKVADAQNMQFAQGLFNAGDYQGAANFIMQHPELRGQVPPQVLIFLGLVDEPPPQIDTGNWNMPPGALAAQQQPAGTQQQAQAGGADILSLLAGAIGGGGTGATGTTGGTGGLDIFSLFNAMSSLMGGQQQTGGATGTQQQQQLSDPFAFLTQQSQAQTNPFQFQQTQSTGQFDLASMMEQFNMMSQMFAGMMGTSGETTDV